ncbi:MAG: hypothetical protein ACAI43_01125 [Phycisphaerae bacterium]
MDVKLMRCSRCAKQMLHAARFCPRCGLGLGTAAAKPTGYTFVAGAGGVAVAPPPPVLTVEPTVAPPPPPRKKPPKARPHPPIEPKRTEPIPYPPPDYLEKAKQKAEQDRQAAAKRKQKSSGGGGAALFWLILIGGIIALRAGVFDKKKTTIPGIPPSQHRVFTPGGSPVDRSLPSAGLDQHYEAPEVVIPPHTIHLTVPPERGGVRPIPPAPRLGSDTGRPLPPTQPGNDNVGGTIVWDPISRSYKFIPNSTGAYRDPR